jgi:glutamine synthetase adenylyltransferase
MIMSTNNVTANAMQERRKDIPTSVIFDAHVAANKAGETIDGLVKRITDAVGIVLHGEEDKKSFIAVLNVRRSNIKKRIEGEFQAERTDLEKKLQEAIASTGEASEESNGIRKELRELDKSETTMLSVFDLARRGRTGDRPGMSFRSLLADAVLKSVTPSDSAPADSVADITVE